MKAKMYKNDVINAILVLMLLILSAGTIANAQDWKQGRDVIKGYKGWEGNPDSLSVHIDPAFDSIQKADIRAAMKRWNDAGCTPKFKETSSTPANVSIKKGDPGEGAEGIWEPSVNPTSGKRDSGVITVKTNPSGLSFKELVTHELGHALGLDDTKNGSDVMVGKGANGTGGNLSKHDSTEMKAAAAIASKSDVPVKKAENNKAVEKGTAQQLTFILDGPPPLPGSPIETLIVPMGEDMIEVFNTILNWPMLEIMVFVDPARGDGTFYLDILIERPEPEFFFYELIGYHYVADFPVNPTHFDCNFVLVQDGSWVTLEWMHTYPIPTTSLRTTLLVNGNPWKFDKFSNQYEFQLEPGIYDLTLVVDDYQVNSASFTSTFEMQAPSYAATIFAGKDHYTVPMATFGFGPGFEDPPLPAGFFGPGSEPFEGAISFEGLTSGGSQLPYADMDIQRMVDYGFSDPLPSIGEVPVLVNIMNLKSKAPVVVPRDDGFPVDSFFDVFIEISFSSRVNDVAIITQEDQWGGTFSMNLTLQPSFRFVNVDNPGEQYIWSGTSLVFNSTAPYSWTLSPIPGEFDPIGNEPLTLNTSMGTTISLLPLLIREGDNFMVEVDEAGMVVNWQGNGYNNGEWFYYPFTDWWNVWFYDHPMDVTRQKYITQGNFILQPRMGGSGPSMFEMVFNYTTPSWPGWPGMPRPPLPPDFQNIQEEMTMIQRSDPVLVYQGTITEPIPFPAPPPLPPIVPWYNPEWLSIDMRGYNYILSGTINHVCFTAWNPPVLFDFGDAPEGALAYPASGMIGQFPTCINVGPPGSFIQHNNFGAFFGPAIDFEPDGNAGFCPLFNPNTYNQDECFMDGDAGLLIPGAFTIVGNPGSESVVLCPGSPLMPMGNVCAPAIWGGNIDIHVQNFMPNMTNGFVNVIIDWDQNGIWGGISSCPGGVNVPEHVLINFPVPNGFNGPLSMLMPPGFIIGPNVGYVWARFTITEMPVMLPWDGSGTFEDGETEDYLLLLDAPPPPDLDFGDAPDPTYPTLAASNGARHGNNPPGYFMGTLIDYEPDGQPTPNASGDDLNNLQDEDGLSYTSPATVGQSYTWLVQTSMLGGFINIWVDFNCDGDWADAGEHVVIDAVSNNPTMGFSIAIPANATPGNAFVRVRFSSVQGLSYNGFAPSGEVEDYMLTIAGLPQYDFGDAPDQPWNNYFYPTLLASNGARHLIVSGVHLGNLIDAEADGLTDINSLGDDQNNLADEDGVLANWHSYMSVGYPMNLKVNASTSGMLDAWMDFNKDGDWNDAGEQIFTSVPLSPGDNYVSFIIPRNANAGFTPFPYSSRYRFSTAGGLSYTGVATDGEVEDYAIGFFLNTLYQWSQPHKQAHSSWPGIHCHDAMVSGQLQILVNADDFISYEGNVSGIMWYGCYEIQGSGINRFHLSLHNSMQGCLPADPEIWGADVLLGSVNETATGNFNSLGEMIYRYEYYLPTPVQLQAGSTYWLDISARCNNPNVPARWKWMESSRSRMTSLCPAVQRVIIAGVPSVWSPLYWASNNTHSEMAFEIMSAMDFGDAPSPYPTTLANNGACHSNWWGPLHLGNVIDYESDGLPDPNALGDDNNNLQDEDGIVFLSPLYIGQNVAIQVTVTGSGLLQGWVDFNRNGSWSDPGEQIMLNLPVSTGTFVHNFLVPPNAVAGPSFARFRLSTWTLPANIFDGYLPSGEVEDYAVEITDAFFDFGDAPEGALAYPASGVVGQFPTCINVGPPGSFIQHSNLGAFLGPTIDPELDGNAGFCPLFNPNTYNQDECFQDGDAGLLIPGAFTVVGPPGAEVIAPCPGSPPIPLGNVCTPAIWSGNIDIHVQNLMPGNAVAYVNVLFDWDHSGTWSGFITCAGGQQVPEHALVNHVVPNGFLGPLSGTNPLPFTIGSFSGYVWARISITEQPVPANWDGSGIFEDGETEDYIFLVLPDPNINLQNITVPGGQTNCYEAAQTITTAGTGTTFIVQNGAVVYLVAGQNVIMKDGTHFKSGSYVHAYIDHTGEYCSNPKAIVFEEEPVPELLPFEIAEKDLFFKVYPNPNTGQFTLELSEFSEFPTIKVEIFSLIGESIMSVELPELKQYQFDLSARQPGIYLIRVTQGNHLGVEKVIKQ